MEGCQTELRAVHFQSMRSPPLIENVAPVM
jgi:hypothetical protein